MKRIFLNSKPGTKSTFISTGLIILSVILLVAGIILIMIDPIKRFNRRRISADALKTVESKIRTSETVDVQDKEEPQMTYIVPRKGNEVEGEAFDYIGETEETEEEEEYYEEEYVVDRKSVV